MIRKKQLLFMILSVFIAFSVFPENEKKKYSPPRGDEVVLVMRVMVSPSIDTSFLSKYWTLTPRTFRISRGKKSYKNEARFLYGKTMEMGGPVFSQEVSDLYTIGEFVTIKAKFPKSREIGITGLQMYLVGANFFRVAVPLLVETIVPENATYVYIGTLDVQQLSPSYTITGVDLVDEFDEAVEVVAMRYGTLARLVRAPVKRKD